MKKISLTMLIVLLVMLAMPAKGFAREFKIKSSTIENAFKAFPVNLKSEYPGIVESTIYNIIVLKRYYPEGDYSDFRKKLNYISEKDSDPTIRFKANLASIYLSFSTMIEIEHVEGSDHEYIFNQITEQLKNKLLVSN